MHNSHFAVHQIDNIVLINQLYTSIEKKQTGLPW